MPDEPAAITLLQRREIEARIVGASGPRRDGRTRRGQDAGPAPRRDRRPRPRGGRGPRPRAGRRLAAGVRPGARPLEGGRGAGDRACSRSPPDRLDFDVTRCRYAEMYRALGLADLGGTLSCCRDFALIEGFNPEVTLTRTQTIMEGATHCDFRFQARRPGPPSRRGPRAEATGSRRCPRPPAVCMAPRLASDRPEHPIEGMAASQDPGARDRADRPRRSRRRAEGFGPASIGRSDSSRYAQEGPTA